MSHKFFGFCSLTSGKLCSSRKTFCASDVRLLNPLSNCSQTNSIPTWGFVMPMFWTLLTICKALSVVRRERWFSHSAAIMSSPLSSVSNDDCVFSIVSSPLGLFLIPYSANCLFAAHIRLSVCSDSWEQDCWWPVVQPDGDRFELFILTSALLVCLVDTPSPPLWPNGCIDELCRSFPVPVNSHRTRPTVNCAVWWSSFRDALFLKTKYSLNWGMPPFCIVSAITSIWFVFAITPLSFGFFMLCSPV